MKRFAVVLEDSAVPGPERRDAIWVEFYSAEDAEHAQEQARNAHPSWAAVQVVAADPEQVKPWRPWVAILGGPMSGFTIHGPFDDAVQASAWTLRPEANPDVASWVTFLYPTKGEAS